MHEIIWDLLMVEYDFSWNRDKNGMTFRERFDAVVRSFYATK